MVKKLKEIIFKLPTWFLTGITLAAILWLTLSPRPFGQITPPLFPGADKLAHALMFGFLVAMMALDRARKKAHSADTISSQTLSSLYLFSCALISSMLGVAIEYLQEWLNTGRAFEYSDMIADSCGAFGTSIICLILQPKKTDSV